MAHLSWKNIFGTNHCYHFNLPIGPFHCGKCLKKILTADPQLWECTIFGPKMVHLPQTKNFLEKNIYIIFIYLLAPFIVQSFLKKILHQTQSYKDALFWAQNGPFTPIKNLKKLLSFSSTCWPLLLCKTLKNFLKWIQSYENAPFWGPK